MASWLLTLLTCFMPADGGCTILEFTAEQCQPCAQMAPTLQQLANEGWDIRQVDVHQHRQLVSRFGVSNLPTLVILDGNKEVDRIVGVTRYAEVKKRLDRVAARSGFRPSASGLANTAEPALRSELSQPSAALASNHQDPRAQSSGAQSSGAQSSGAQSSGAPFSGPQPIVRGQSPMRAVPKLVSGAASMAKEISNSSAGLAGQDAIARARDATVRIRVDEGNTTAHGTGTIVDAHGSQALILTCGHLFRDMNPSSQLSVDLFAGTPREQRVPAQLVDFSVEDEDIGLITISLPVAIAPVEILPRQEAVNTGQSVFSFGCDHGQDPSLREASVTHVNRYLGAANVEISGAPAVGRSGGGLFDRRGRLIGVCNAANEPENEGIYAGPDVFYRQLTKLNLQHLFEGGGSSTRQIQGAPNPAIEPTTPTPLQHDIAASTPSSEMNWPDQGLGDIATPERKVEPQGLPSTATAPVARQLIVIVKSDNGADRVVTIDQPSPELVSQIRSQSGNAW